ncbi:hypothetical protein T05_10022 [Trichinella murrelli]|uniref:Uncharacterized protein n=1 Tax=Trichinella murrelli TaxID=144512 RepID=A0A0V0T4P8_9BILA|nr:hypothetical protein T05_10022 [Trichinella murrelli]
MSSHEARTDANQCSTGVSMAFSRRPSVPLLITNIAGVSYGSDFPCHARTCIPLTCALLHYPHYLYQYFTLSRVEADIKMSVKCRLLVEYGKALLSIQVIGEHVSMELQKAPGAEIFLKRIPEGMPWA